MGDLKLSGVPDVGPRVGLLGLLFSRPDPRRDVRLFTGVGEGGYFQVFSVQKDLVHTRSTLSRSDFGFS